jgi:uncharacterized protein
MLTEEIEKLVRLQELDNEIKALEETVNNYPLQKKQMEQSVESSVKDITVLKKEQKKLQVERKEKELEIQENEEATKKLLKSLDEVKTNKEYTSLLSEIETLKKKKSGLEDTLLLMMEKDEQLNKQLADFSSKSDRLKTEIEDKVQEEGKKIEDMRVQLQEKISLREKLVPDIDREIYTLYEKIRKSKKDGIAICKLEGESCSGCSVFVPTYMAEKVKAKKQIVQCENCSRILY